MPASTPPPTPGATTVAASGTYGPRRALTFARPVTGLDVALALLAVVLVPAAAAVLVVVAGLKLDQTWLLGVVVPLATLVSFGGVWTALIRRGWLWRDLGFVRGCRSSWHLVWQVPLVWAAALILTALIGSLSGIEPTGGETTTSNSADALQLGIGALVATALCVTLLMPALEEILFRRLVYGWLEQRFNLIVAVAGSAAAFGLVHVAPPVIALQFLIGLGAATLVRWHRTLWASFALHALNNGVVTILAVSVLR